MIDQASSSVDEVSGIELCLSYQKKMYVRIPKWTEQICLQENNKNSIMHWHFKANYCLKVHSVHLKLALSIAG